MMTYQLLRLNLFYAALENRMEELFDLNIWFMLQFYYMPHYIIGKQDEWADWVGSSTNGWGPNKFSICKL